MTDQTKITIANGVKVKPGAPVYSGGLKGWGPMPIPADPEAWDGQEVHFEDGCIVGSDALHLSRNEAIEASIEYYRREKRGHLKSIERCEASIAELEAEKE